MTIPDSSLTIGKTVWAVTKEKDIIECKISKITIDKKGMRIMVRGNWFRKFSWGEEIQDYKPWFKVDSVGKSLFFSQEEALKAIN